MQNCIHKVSHISSVHKKTDQIQLHLQFQVKEQKLQQKIQQK